MFVGGEGLFHYLLSAPVAFLLPAFLYLLSRIVSLCFPLITQNSNLHTQQTEVIAKLVDMAGNSLKKGGHIYYIGEGALAVMGFIDASEMPDTYGTPHTEVRAFVDGGWQTMGNAAGDLTEKHELFHISLDHFECEFLCSLTSNDTVIAITRGGQDGSWGKAISELLSQCEEFGAATGVVRVYSQGSVAPRKSSTKFDCECDVVLPSLDLFPGSDDTMLASLATKWVLNAVTTGANVQNGMVLQNRMINLTVANNKLYHRSVGIVATFTGVDLEEAEKALVKAIYRKDDIEEEWNSNAPLSQLITVATERERVIPLAIALTTKGVTVAKAEALMKKQKNVKRLVESLRK